MWSKLSTTLVVISNITVRYITVHTLYYFKNTVKYCSNIEHFSTALDAYTDLW